MEEKTRSASVHALNYGLITGAVLIVYSMVLNLLGLNFNAVLPYLSLLFLIGGMIWATISYRDQYLKGYISFGKAFTTAFLTGLFAGILGAIFTYVYLKFINPDMVLQIMDNAREKVMEKAPDLTEDQLDTALAWQAKFMKPAVMAISSAIYTAFASALLGLIVAAIFKKEDKTLTNIV
jgi:hypothetical protein